MPADDAAARSGMLAAAMGEWLTDGLIELYEDYRRPDGTPPGCTARSAT